MAKAEAPGDPGGYMKSYFCRLQIIFVLLLLAKSSISRFFGLSRQKASVYSMRFRWMFDSPAISGVLETASR